jgi:hypothetical protein
VQGSPIPLDLPGEERRGRLEENGKPVLSRLEEEPLREIAAASGGVYESVRTRAAPLGPLYLQWIASSPVREDNEDAVPVYRQRPTPFLLVAFVCLAGALALGDRSPRSPTTGTPS